MARSAIVVPEERGDASRNPLEVTGETPGDKTDVSAFTGKFEGDGVRYLCVRRKRALGHEWIVARVHDERRNCNSGKPGLAARARPVVIRVPKTVEWRSDGVIERAKRPRRAHACGVIQTGMRCELLE